MRFLLLLAAIVPLCSHPSAAQSPTRADFDGVDSHEAESLSTADSPSSRLHSSQFILNASSAAPTAHYPVSYYFVQPWRPISSQHTGFLPDRPDSDLPKTFRYILGGVFVGISTASLVGSIGLSVGAVRGFQNDDPFSDFAAVGAVVLAGGSLGLSIMSGIWASRLFRGKVILIPPSQ
jgi:hypothetical protein